MPISPTPWKAGHSGTGDATVISAPIETLHGPFTVTIVQRCSWEDAYLIEAAHKLLELLELEHKKVIEGYQDWDTIEHQYVHIPSECEVCCCILELKKKAGIK